MKADRIHIISNGKGEFYIFLLQHIVNGLSCETLLFPNVNKSEIFYFLNFECHCSLDISLILNITIFVIIF